MTDTVAKNLASHGVRWCLGTFPAMRLALTAWPALVLRVYSIDIPWQDPVGVALVVPLAYLWWRTKVPRKTSGLSLLAVLVAFLAWALYVQLGPGGEFPWDVQGRIWHEQLGWPWEGMVRNVLALCGCYPGVPSSLPVFLDLFAVTMFAALIIIAFRVLPREYMLLMVSLFFVPLVKLSGDGLLRAMSRYVLPLFPGFVLLARAGRRPRSHWPWICLSFTLRAIASAAFFLWFWVT